MKKKKIQQNLHIPILSEKVGFCYFTVMLSFQKQGLFQASTEILKQMRDDSDKVRPWFII